MNYFILLSLIYLSYSVELNNGANILALFPMVTKSHAIVGYDLCETLAKRGHNVTHVSAFPRGIKFPNYHEVNLTDFVNPFQDVKQDSDKLLKWVNQNFIVKTNTVFHLIRNTTEIVLKDRNLQRIINSKQKFDVVIMGAFSQEALLGIGYHLKAPIIITAPPGMNLFVDDFVWNPAPFSYVPNGLFGFTDHMTFYERLINTLFGTYIKIYKFIVHYPIQNLILQKYFPKAPDVYELQKNISIVLSNSHESIAYPRPLVPNVIQVGGLHVSKPKPLPEDLQKFMDNAPNGVIFFSLGSFVRSKEITNNTKNSFVKAFSRLKQKVLWKWDEPTIPGLSSNVRISKWYPQNDVLAHPNIKIFITHGGLLSTTETVVRGVPIIGIPIFADQFINMKRASDLGFCVILDFVNITEESILQAVNEVLNNKKYYQNVKRRSEIINDQLVHPLDKAVYWVEYVIRHKGASHLRSAGADIPLYQYLLLDVIGFILLIFLFIFSIIYLMIKISSSYLKKFVKSKKTKIE